MSKITNDRLSRDPSGSLVQLHQCGNSGRQGVNVCLAMLVDQLMFVMCRSSE